QPGNMVAYPQGRLTWNGAMHFDFNIKDLAQLTAKILHITCIVWIIRMFMQAMPVYQIKPFTDCGDGCKDFSGIEKEFCKAAYLSCLIVYSRVHKKITKS